MDRNLKFPDGWPESWAGDTVVDTGTSGKFRCELITDATPHLGHIDNYRAILEHIDEVWPHAYTYIYNTSRDWEITAPLKNPYAHLQITIPSNPIGYGESWSISAQWNDNSTWFNAEFIGWKFDEDSSQPYC